MKVLYDITTLAHIYCAAGVRPTGIFKAVEAMGMALAGTADIDLYLSTNPSQYDKALRYLEESQRFDVKRLVLPALTSGRRRLLPRVRRRRQPAPVYNTGAFDIYHVNWRGEDRLPAGDHPNIVLTVFDVIALKHPEWFVTPGEPNTIGAYLVRLLNSVRASHAISVNTESVKRDLLAFFPHLSEEQIHVTPLGVSPMFQPCRDQVAIYDIKQKYGIPRDRQYILCVNTLEPRKNMVSAIKAYSKLTAENRMDDICLVLAGSSGWLSEEIFSLSNSQNDRCRSPVYVTGYVDDHDLPILYSGASLFCYPSLDEGFGMPVLEAMRCGVPVITSKRAPLMEVAGDDALYVAPTDATALAETMFALLTDTERAAALAARGEVRARSFTWERSARVLAGVYEKVVKARNSKNLITIHRVERP